MSNRTDAYERLLDFYKKRNRDHDAGRRFFGAVIMYQVFTGEKTVPLSQRLRKDAEEAETSV
jgi:hypothetical protein